MDKDKIVKKIKFLKEFEKKSVKALLIAIGIILIISLGSLLIIPFILIFFRALLMAVVMILLIVTAGLRISLSYYSIIGKQPIKFVSWLLTIISIAFFLFVLFIIVVSLSYGPSARAKPRDNRRMSDMNQLVSSQAMYYGETDHYAVSDIMPTMIGTYLNPVPMDPGGGTIIPCDFAVPAFTYCTISNEENDQKFCYYARLEENAALPFFTASHAGNFKRANPPKTLDECAEGE